MRRRYHEDDTMSLTDHLRGLRKVLVVAAYAIAGGTIIGWFISDFAFGFLSRPVSLLENIMFITTTPMEPMLVKLKVSMIVGVALALPVLMWNIWNFVLPALKQNERGYLYFIVPTSVLLFLGGAAFCFYLVLPVGIKFLLYAGSEAVQSTPFVTKASYISFLLTFLLTFGLVFQLPIVLLILIRIGMLSPETLAQKRRWAILSIVILTAVVSPTPDLFTQFLMVGPMYLLYEISIWIGYFVVRNVKQP